MNTPPFFGLYRIKLRRSDKFKVKPEAEQIDGMTFKLLRSWDITEEDSSIYVGEWALTPRWSDLTYPDTAPTWIASGDAELLEEVTYE